MRKLTYLVACSADGFIARTSGSFDYFLSEGDHLTDLVQCFPETIPSHLRAALNAGSENKVFDAVLMGRRTYEAGLPFGVTNPYGHMKQYVFSRSMTAPPDPAVELVSGDPLPFVQTLKQQDGKGIWLCGGADLAAVLFPQIDELMLKVNPVAIGAGIPIFAREVPATRLRLASSKIYANGFILSRYLKESS